MGGGISSKLGWRTFTKAHAEQNTVLKLNKLLFVREATSDQEGQLPLVFDVYFKLFVQMEPSISGLINSCFIRSRSLFLAVSVVLSRDVTIWCESLGYQCSATDRKHMINKLSCFSSPLYPPSFFLK